MKKVFLKKKKLHQNPISSRHFIENQFHPKPISSKTIFHQKPHSSKMKLTQLKKKRNKMTHNWGGTNNVVRALCQPKARDVPQEGLLKIETTDLFDIHLYVPSARTWITSQDASRGVHHNDMLNRGTRLEAESSVSDVLVEFLLLPRELKKKKPTATGSKSWRILCANLKVDGKKHCDGSNL